MHYVTPPPAAVILRTCITWYPLTLELHWQWVAGWCRPGVLLKVLMPPGQGTVLLVHVAICQEITSRHTVERYALCFPHTSQKMKKKHNHSWPPNSTFKILPVVWGSHKIIKNMLFPEMHPQLLLGETTGALDISKYHSIKKAG